MATSAAIKPEAQRPKKNREKSNESEDDSMSYFKVSWWEKYKIIIISIIAIIIGIGLIYLSSGSHKEQADENKVEQTRKLNAGLPQYTITFTEPSYNELTPGYVYTFWTKTDDGQIDFFIHKYNIRLSLKYNKFYDQSGREVRFPKGITNITFIPIGGEQTLLYTCERLPSHL